MILLFSLSTRGNSARCEGYDSATPASIGLARLVLLEVQRSNQPVAVHSVGIPSQNELLVPRSWRMEAQTPPCPLPFAQAQAPTGHPPAHEQGL